ncbi:MAG: hypothetical protein IT518_25530 [Burkholderiales bacterium]|nr:hypothetical protein [Burkholderiales bacterium]
MTSDAASPPLRPATAGRAVPGPEVPFSLFEGDGLRRAWAALGLGSHTRFRNVWRCALASFVCYAPMAVLAWRQGLAGAEISPTNFFADFAAYVQFLIGLPLFLAAEVIIDGSTKDAANEFFRCRIIRAEDAPRFERTHAAIARLRQSLWSDAACVALAYGISLAILVPQFDTNPLPTWHVHGIGSARRLTAPGWWAFFVALPFLNYVWLRIGWKTFLWVYYLYRVSRVRLDLHPTHPDLTGGIGFISETQGRFALFILAYGLSNVAAPVGYEIAVQNYDFTIMPVWGPVVGFIVGAPLLFTLPLFMFTKQLFRTRKRALAAYRERVTEHSRLVESRWLFGDGTLSSQEEARDIAEQSTLGTMFARIERMRVVPFDLRSFGQLLGSTLGAMATLLPLLHTRGETAAVVEAVGKLLGQMGGH